MVGGIRGKPRGKWPLKAKTYNSRKLLVCDRKAIASTRVKIDSSRSAVTVLTKILKHDEGRIIGCGRILAEN